MFRLKNLVHKVLTGALKAVAALMAASAGESDDSWAPAAADGDSLRGGEGSDDSWAPSEPPFDAAAAPASASESDGSWAPSPAPGDRALSPRGGEDFFW